MMPGEDGIQVCRELKADPSLPFMPVILVTAKSDPDDIVAGLDAGGDEYITKPVDHAALVARVRSILRVKALHDTVQEQAAHLEEWNRTLEQRVAVQHRSRSVGATADDPRTSRPAHGARRLGPGRPRSIGSDGAGAWVMVSQARQLIFGRTWTTTLKCEGTYSSTSRSSVPIRYGFDGLSAKVASVLALDPFSGHLAPALPTRPVAV